MARYRPEPAFAHDVPRRVGVLLVNLGTPDAPTAPAVRRYLAQFLSDRRVIEIPPAVWQPILHGVILRTRPAKSAQRYASIWMPEGSPLMVYSRRQTALLRGYLGQRLKEQGLPSDHAMIALGMRYGTPSIATALDELRAGGCDRILVLPLYPQYSASTTATAVDEVFAAVQSMRRVPGLRFVDAYHDDPGYIGALAESINSYWLQHGRPDTLVLSFHGVTRRSLELGDPYHCHCQKTGRLLAQELGLERTQYQVTFQSRFGRAEWLQPYTQPTLIALARAGCGRVDVACPGFVSDCLETLEEIAQEGRDDFLKAGGREFNYIPCLNDRPQWIAALTDIALANLGGWLEQPASAEARERTRERAKALGAAA